MVSALAHDVHYLVIGVGGILIANNNGQALMDVLRDPAGGTSWASFIDDLMVGFSALASGSIPPVCWYHFPIYIKSGSSLGVQARTAHTADITSGQVVMYAFGEPSRPDMWWCGSRVESLGVTAASSSGTSVTPGTTGTYGSWTDLGATSGRYRAIQLGFGGTDATAAAVGYFTQIGVSSSQLAGTPLFHHTVTTGEVSGRHWSMPVWCDIAPGATVQARSTATAGTTETLQIAAYGVY